MAELFCLFRTLFRYALFSRIMRWNSSDAKWPGRDRFVLSNGHACALLYSMLHLAGYGVSIEDLSNFRKAGSKTPGHPENFCTNGVEVSTGPLGQGISNAVGLAIAEAHLAENFNQSDCRKLIDNFTYVICGDGCLQEGVASEACSLAGHLGLGNLIVLYDDNSITIDGNTSLSFSEDVLQRFESYGWHTSSVTDGTDVNAICAAVENAQTVRDKPSIIKVTTIIGHGSVIQGSEKTHGSPLAADDIKQFKVACGFDPEKSFVVPSDVQKLFSAKRQAGVEAQAEWEKNFSTYKAKHPELAAEFERRVLKGALPVDWKNTMPKYSISDKPKATRALSGEVLNAVAVSLPELVGGSADLTGSNVTKIKDAVDFQKATPEGRYLRFGVREHGMQAIANGLFSYGGIRPFTATFLNFVGYAQGSVRLSALSKFGVICIATHDSIGLGEDGPTHQPIEMLESLRATPNLYCFRPADGNETVGSYVMALESPGTPSVLVFSRQAVPNLEGSSSDGVARGGYALPTIGEGSIGLVLVSSGTEVSLCVDVAKAVNKETGIAVRVVSMPCMDLFDEQPASYKSTVLPEGVPVMSVEASGVHGWDKYAHAVYGMKGFGMSGKGSDLYKIFGFSIEHLVNEAKKVLDFYKTNSVPNLLNRPPISLIGFGTH